MTCFQTLTIIWQSFISKIYQLIQCEEKLIQWSKKRTRDIGTDNLKNFILHLGLVLNICAQEVSHYVHKTHSVLYSAWINTHSLCSNMAQFGLSLAKCILYTVSLKSSSERFLHQPSFLGNFHQHLRCQHEKKNLTALSYAGEKTSLGHHQMLFP